MARFLRRALWEPYQRAVAARPVMTKCATSGVLLGAGDLVAQLAIERKPLPDVDLKRFARMTAVGTFITGPLVVGWYGTLDKVVRVNSTTVQAITKTALDQTIFAPFIISTFFTVNAVFEGRPLEQVPDIIRHKLWPTLLANWTVWPAAGLINFKFVPPQNRVLFMSSFALFWNTYLSTVGNKH